jgi:hypothetical protein
MNRIYVVLLRRNGCPCSVCDLKGFNSENSCCIQYLWYVGYQRFEGFLNMEFPTEIFVTTTEIFLGVITRKTTICIVILSCCHGCIQ